MYVYIYIYRCEQLLYSPAHMWLWELFTDKAKHLNASLETPTETAT